MSGSQPSTPEKDERPSPGTGAIPTVTTGDTSSTTTIASAARPTVSGAKRSFPKSKSASELTCSFAAPTPPKRTPPPVNPYMQKCASTGALPRRASRKVLHGGVVPSSRINPHIEALTAEMKSAMECALPPALITPWPRNPDSTSSSVAPSAQMGGPTPRMLFQQASASASALPNKPRLLSAQSASLLAGSLLQQQRPPVIGSPLRSASPYAVSSPQGSSVWTPLQSGSASTMTSQQSWSASAMTSQQSWSASAMTSQQSWSASAVTSQQSTSASPVPSGPWLWNTQYTSLLAGPLPQEHRPPVIWSPLRSASPYAVLSPHRSSVWTPLKSGSASAMTSQKSWSASAMTSQQSWLASAMTSQQSGSASAMTSQQSTSASPVPSGPWLWNTQYASLLAGPSPQQHRPPVIVSPLRSASPYAVLSPHGYSMWTPLQSGSASAMTSSQQSGLASTVTSQQSGSASTVTSQQSGSASTVTSQQSGSASTVTSQQSGSASTVTLQQSGSASTVTSQQNGWPSAVLPQGQMPGQNPLPIVPHGPTDDKAIIQLTAGGLQYKSTLHTLTKEADSELARIIRDPRARRDAHGRYLIDADGWLFRHILLFLQDDILPPLYCAEAAHKIAADFRLEGLRQRLEERYPSLAKNEENESSKRGQPPMGM